MCLRAEVIDNNDSRVGRVVRAKGIRNDNGGVSRGQGICNASEGLETTTIRRGLDYGPKESMTTMEASKEEDEQEDYNNDNGCVDRG